VSFCILIGWSASFSAATKRPSFRIAHFLMKGISYFAVFPSSPARKMVSFKLAAAALALSGAATA
jgi:hypothetical protein